MFKKKPKVKIVKEVKRDFSTPMTSNKFQVVYMIKVRTEDGWYRTEAEATTQEEAHELGLIFLEDGVLIEELYE